MREEKDVYGVLQRKPEHAREEAPQRREVRVWCEEGVGFGGAQENLEVFESREGLSGVGSWIAVLRLEAAIPNREERATLGNASAACDGAGRACIKVIIEVGNERRIAVGSDYVWYRGAGERAYRKPEEVVEGRYLGLGR